jgi:hypothetical protein
VNTPSGWYPDATRPNTERFWNGWTWTDQARWPGVKPHEWPIPPGLPDPQVTPPAVSMFETSSVGYSLPTGQAAGEGAKGTQVLGRLRHARRR